MRILDYLIYHLRPFGNQIERRPVLPEAPPDLNLTAIPWFAPNVTSNETSSITGTIQTFDLNLIYL